MTKKNTILRKGESFGEFLLNKSQRIDWYILIGGCIAAYILMKICYPYPNASWSDSGAYVVCAVNNRFGVFRPFGYSVFLHFLHGISSSIHAIFIAQMLMYLLSTAAFAFSIKYLFRPKSNILWYGMLCFLLISPISIYLANTMMSDMLFTALVYVMLASFAFIVGRKSWIALIVYSLTLFCALHVRYSAMVFPFFFLPFFFMTKGSIRWVAIVMSAIVFAVFHRQVKEEMRTVTNINQFETGFTGWQLLSNALHVLPHIDGAEPAGRNRDLRAIHSFMMSQRDSIAKRTKNGVAVFLWDNNGPLKQYFRYQMQQMQSIYLITWIQLGSGIYGDYARYLIKHYPMEYVRYFWLPNMASVFYHKNFELIARYSYNATTGKSILEYYGLPEETKLECRCDIYAGFVNTATRWFGVLIWLAIFGVGVLAIVRRKALHFSRTELLIFWGIFVFGVLYYASNTFAAPVVVRYWAPMKCVQFAFLYILLNRMLAPSPTAGA